MVENDLKIMFELNREKAFSNITEKKEYDTLLDIYEPNITQDLVSEYFEELKDGVIKVQNLSLNKESK
jgi:Zn-dependent M32 family carboxypeptidase